MSTPPVLATVIITAIIIIVSACAKSQGFKDVVNKSLPPKLIILWGRQTCLCHTQCELVSPRMKAGPHAMGV